MINRKRLAHPDDHMQQAGKSRWSFAKGQPIRMINCKRLVDPDDLDDPDDWGDQG